MRHIGKGAAAAGILALFIMTGAKLDKMEKANKEQEYAYKINMDYYDGFRETVALNNRLKTDKEFACTYGQSDKEWVNGKCQETEQARNFRLFKERQKKHCERTGGLWQDLNGICYPLEDKCDCRCCDTQNFSSYPSYIQVPTRF